MIRNADAFGKALWAGYQKGSAMHVIERDDGYVEPHDGGLYFQEAHHWSPKVRKALRLARGRVLDIGCGAGRHAIHLQKKGHDVLGIDESPLAIKTSRARGLRRAKVVPIQRMSEGLGTFDTVIMLGNNFGLFGTPSNARRLLRRLLRMTSPDARVIAESDDV